MGGRSRARRVPLRAALLIAAPAQDVRAAIGSAATWARASAAAGGTFEIAGRGGSDGEALRSGELVRIGARPRFGGIRAAGSALLRVDRADVTTDGEVLRLTGVGRRVGWTVTVTTSATPAGSLVTVDVRPGGAAVGLRTRVLRAAELLLGVTLLAATERTARAAGAAGTDGDGSARPVVVAGVVVRDGAILAARRTYPPELAGLWECPGGKVEPGESEPDALARELDEELGIEVRVGERVGPEYDIGHGYVLHAYLVELTAGAPSPTVHDSIRWVSLDEIDDVAWLPSDRPLLPVLRGLLVARL